MCLFLGVSRCNTHHRDFVDRRLFRELIGDIGVSKGALGKGIALFVLAGFFVVGVFLFASLDGDLAEAAEGDSDTEVVEVAQTSAATDDETGNESAEVEEIVTTPAAPTTSTTTTSSTSTSTSTSTSSTVAPTTSTTSSTTTTTAAPTTTTTTVVAAQEISVDTDQDAPAQDEGNPDEIAGDAAEVREAVFEGDFPMRVVALNGEFFRLEPRLNGNGFNIARSPDGLDWETERTTGLPGGNGYVRNIVAGADGLVALLAVYPVVDFVEPYTVLFESGLLDDDQVAEVCEIWLDDVGEPIDVFTCNYDALDAAYAELEEALENAETDEEVEALFEEFYALEQELMEQLVILTLVPGDDFYDDIADAFAAQRAFYNTPPEEVVATSSDGISWATTDLTGLPVEEGGSFYISGAAVSGDSLAILVGIKPAEIDPYEILLDSGLVEQEELSELCNITGGDSGEPLVLFACDYEALDAAYTEAEEAFANAETDEEVDAILEAFYELEEELRAGQEFLRLEPQNELYDDVVDGFFGRPTQMPVVLVGTIGENLSVVELPVTGYPYTILGTSAGFLATVYDDNTGRSSVLRSTDGLSWAEFEQPNRIERVLEDRPVAANDEFALAVVVTRDETPVVLTSDDLGETWTESEIPTELFGVNPRPVAGPVGFATLIEGTSEPITSYGPEIVEVVQGDFVMVVQPNNWKASLQAADGTVIHDPVNIDKAISEGEIPGVIIVEGGEDFQWLDPDTGEVLVVFTYSEIDSALDAAYDAWEAAQPTPVRELWFSADGETWTLIQSIEVEGEQYTRIAAVGDDEVLLLTEAYPVAPEDLFLFEEEGREPTPEEEEAILEFYAMGPTFTWTSVPIAASPIQAANLA